MGKRSKQQKKGRDAKARPSEKKPWDRPAKTPLHGGFSGRPSGRPQTNLRQGRGRA